MLSSPHRGQVHRLLELTTDAARLSGQVNCIERRGKDLKGHNTEGLALRRLVEGSVPLKGVAATILGSGRLAKSVVAELALAGAAVIEIACLEPAQLTTLIQTLHAEPATAATEIRVTPWPAAGWAPTAANCRLLMNATPVGRQDIDARLPVDMDRLSTDMFVVDAVYNPPGTRLIREVRKRGLKTVDGVALLVEQAAIAFEIWTGRKPDRDAMREAVEEFLVL